MLDRLTEAVDVLTCVGQVDRGCKSVGRSSHVLDRLTEAVEVLDMLTGVG